MHEEKGVKFYPKTGVESFSASGGKNVVGHVTLTDGTKLDADVVVAGTGRGSCYCYYAIVFSRWEMMGYYAVPRKRKICFDAERC